jgi:hypothetical protein
MVVLLFLLNIGRHGWVCACLPRWQLLLLHKERGLVVAAISLIRQWRRRPGGQRWLASPGTAPYIVCNLPPGDNSGPDAGI